MPFKPLAGQPDFSDLETTLNNARIQVTNNALYQTIRALIQKVTQFQQVVVTNIDKTTANITQITAIITGSQLATYLTATSQTPILPNSRQLLAGTGITFDDTVPNKRTISSSAASDEIDPFLLMGA